MKISVALSTIKRLYVEAAPFIYYVEENPNYADRVNAIFEYFDQGKIQGFSSVITLTEVLILPIRNSQSDLETAYRDILLNNTGIELLRVSAEIADRAADLRARYNVRTPDALHIATALEIPCDAFLTNDSTLKRITEISILTIDDLELDTPPS